MTAIAVGKLNSVNFFVADAMVQKNLTSKSYKECTIENKITLITSCDQYLTLCGEGLIADGIGFFDNWHNMHKSKTNLFNSDTFKEVLICAERRRNYSINIHNAKIIPQDSTTVYIANHENIKEYTVEWKNNNFKIIKERYLDEGETFLNYKGNIFPIIVDENKSLFEQGKDAIISEHEDRIKKKNPNKKPLSYSFEDRFSAAIIPRNKGEVKEFYPYKNMTDMYLSYDPPSWDFVLNTSFEYSPILNISK